MVTDVLIGVALLAALVLALEFGYRAGRRAATEADPGTIGQIGAVQAAMLGLLGLLLAFSFAAAAARFFERQDLIVSEANAIGTAYLRADLLDEPDRSALRSALERYTAHRLELAPKLASGLSADVLAEADRLQGVMWSAAIQGVRDKPAVAYLVLPPVNEVIDLHSTRLAASLKRLPSLVLGLLVISSLLALADIGYGSGIGGRRRFALTGSLALLVAAALWITIDLDHPRRGLLCLSDAPLESLRFDHPSDASSNAR